MDALVSLVANVPDWIKRLDELSGQIDQRQLELARLVEPTPSSSPSLPSTPARTKSVRNKGSTESLKPRDEGAAWQQEELEAEEDKNSKKKLTESKADNSNTAKAQPAGGATPPSPTAAALQNQTTQAVTAAQARARATLRKRSKRNNDSVMSVEGAAPKYRTRSLIIVYYDSYVQSFFEELVRFVSAQRNLMRKAKMAAKVAQIKRMAELEMSGSMDNEDDGDDGQEAIAVDSGLSPGYGLEVDPTVPITPGTSAAAKPGGDGDGGGDAIIAASLGPTDGAAPALDNPRTSDMRSPGMLSLGRPMYMRASGRTAYMRGGGGGQGSAYSAGRQQQQQQQPDVYDELDKGLEYVQAMCEHAAHQFLRDGDCNEEIENVKRRLTETKEQAHREMQRAKQNDPDDALGTTDAPIKSRSFRQQTMRKEVPSVTVSGSKGGGISAADALAVAREAHMALEVDEGVEDMDDDPPKLLYRSTRRR